MKRLPGRWLGASALIAGLLAAQLWPAPPISDPTGAALPADLHLAVPWLHIVGAPLFTLWDGVSMLSLSRLQGLLVGLAIVYVVWRIIQLARYRRILWEVVVLVAAVTGFALFVSAGALWHRPMVALTGAPAAARIVDFHSHTNASHDVEGLMADFGLAASRRWHARAGFDAFFVTDHNRVAAVADPTWPTSPPFACPGTEVSAWRAHILLLGATRPVDRRAYPNSLAGVLALIEDAEAGAGAGGGTLAIASLPEYERHQWPHLRDLLGAGLSGFEIVNAAPKANEFTRARRDSIIALARRHDRIILGVSDSHGWGATSMVWNLVTLDAGLTPDQDPCEAILDRLRQGGFEAVQVVERHRLRVDAAWPLWLTPLGVIWETWRGMGWALTGGWLVWILAWALWAPRPLRRPGLATTAKPRPK